MPKVKQDTPVARWTAVWWQKDNETVEDMLARQPILNKFFEDECKHWFYQLERGKDCGKLHFQIRISLKNRVRASFFANAAKEINAIKACDFRPESVNGEKMSKFYHMKRDTRVEGPWSDKDAIPFIPSYWDSTPTFVWHAEARRLLDEATGRQLVLVVDKKGGRGKTALTRLLVKEGAKEVPSFLGTAKDIMRASYAVLDGTNPERTQTLVIDIPRSQTKCQKDFWYHAATALEKVKDGVQVEDRYHFQTFYSQPPRIIAFCNDPPPHDALTHGRWLILSLDDMPEDSLASLGAAL